MIYCRNFCLFVVFLLSTQVSVVYSQELSQADKEYHELNLDESYRYYDRISDDSLLVVKPALLAFIGKLESGSGELEQLKASFLKLRLLTKENKIDNAAQIAESILNNTENDSKANIDIQFRTQLYYAQIKQIEGKKEESNEIHYRLIERINLAAKEFPHINSSELHFKNFLGLASNYLFDNDSLSCVYANKALSNARASGDIKMIHQAIDFTYYCNYFGNNGDLLNSIADSCLHYAKILNNNELLGTAYMHKCNALVILGQPESAQTYCQQAIEEFSKSRDPIYLSSVYNNIGNVFDKIGEDRKALFYYEESYQIAKELGNTEEFLTSIHSLANKFYDLGNYRQAAAYFKTYSDSQLVFQQHVLNSQFSEAEAKYQSGQKEVEIAKQKLDLANQKTIKNRIILGGSALLLLGLILFQWYRNRERSNAMKAEYELKQRSKEAEQLKELDEMKNQFFTNVSHELRTPLTLISGPLESVIEKNTNVSIQKDLKLAYSNSKKLNGLVTEILDLAKIESGKITVKPIVVNLHELINRLFYAFESLAFTKGLRLNLQNRVPRDLFAELDVEKFEKVVNNLVSNAIKFSEQGGEILLDSGVSEGVLLMYVRDEGKGIPIGDEDKIFERFYQVRQENHNLSGGTGVGLALAKEVVELLGGQISATNNNQKGATFHLELPLAITQKESEKKNSKEPDPTDTIHYVPILIHGERPKMLIVEDNLDMAEYIGSILEKEFECSYALDGYEALRMIQKESFDIISSDIMMPRMDGFALKGKINELERFKKLPFIFLSARVLEEDILRGLSLGVDDYITKPFSKSEYLTRVRNLIKNMKARSEVSDSEIDDSVDRKIIKRAENWVLDNLSDPEIKIGTLAAELNYSQRQLGRIIKKLSGFTPVGFVLEIRMLKAHRWIVEKKYETLSEVRHEVGIESASYFSKKFKERFGVSPSEINDA